MMTSLKVRLATVALGILAAAWFSLSYAQAENLVAKCNNRPTFADQRDLMADKINCFLREMVDLRDKNNDLKQLNSAIETIRGVWIDNSQSPYNCRSIDNPRKTTGGICSGIWNEFVFQRHEYFRIHCHLKFSRWNDTVEQHRLAALEKEKQYQSCFSNNIPLSIQEGFSARDRDAFRETYFKMKQELEEFQPLGLTYKNLANACNSQLKGLADYDRSYVDRKKLSCSVR